MTKQEEIKQLKAEQDAVILAHYYVDPQVQELADYVGDSFYLSKVAAGLENRTFVFCGVSFMGESGKLLSPDKVVLMPDAQADYPMAHMVTKEEVKQYRKEYPGLTVARYINLTAGIKSWSDVYVISVNVVQIVRNLPNQDILFIPDKNLGRYVTSQIPEKHMMLVKGCCPVHDQMSPEEASGLEKIYPNVLVLAHPGCNAQVLELADYIGSTTGILKYAAGSTFREFITYVETGARHELEQQNPDKQSYFPDTEPICRDMKKTTLDKIIHVLRTGQNQASVSEAYVPSANRALEQILKLARQPPGCRFQAANSRQPIPKGGIGNDKTYIP